MEKIIITGAAGFIGFHLAKKLLDKGVSVVGLDNMNNYYDIWLKKNRLNILNQYSDFVFIKGDLTDRILLNNLFLEHKPEIVINLAAQAGVRYSIENPDAYINSNIIGFFNLLETCRYNKPKHLIYASSSSVYGANEQVSFSVEDKTDEPVSLYAATKKSNELFAHSYSKLYGIPTTGLRFFTVYGPFGRPDMAYYSFTKKILANKPIQIFNNGNMYRDFTYIDDIIEGIMRLLYLQPKEDRNQVQHKVYNIGNNHPEKLLDFIQILETCIGKKAIKEYYPMQKGDVFRTYANIDPLVQDTGFYPKTSLKEGIRHFVDWYYEYYNN